MQEMSLKSVLDAMSAVLCSNKHISRDVFDCSCTCSHVIRAAFTAWAPLLIKYACNSVIMFACISVLHMIFNSKGQNDLFILLPDFDNALQYIIKRVVNSPKLTGCVVFNHFCRGR